MQHSIKTAVSLPEDLMKRVEKLRASVGINRSQFFLKALQTYIDEFPESGEKKVASLYKQIQETDKKILGQFGQHSYKNLPPYREEE
ncbi:hypothetical protein AUJ66_06220 [Candidatus Desantisbacteria bacterium CG1_02_38_46]|uniref:Ribbon-helix-helix protein CopG domain-containing protein n=2 Tax=unclassified Candidatus Desantisiibacteriota TaxID=3106372 RepID=A0A2H9P9W2_9BACT|nr:MAG: hypothetical protein AUJ66_06220 [Candidatus Desantisbacteria bacterium CG1_02_38_46]PIZ15090.1 MAG: hypothetical protein COY51_06255 [Candidatus Desantisbacteria bacterium CG_4_10_14_0_8_um_filter_39_17]